MNVLFPVLTILASIAFAGLLGHINKTKGKSIDFPPIVLFFWSLALASLMSWGFLQLFEATARGQQSIVRFSTFFRDGLPIAYLGLGLAGLIWTRRIAQRIILSLGIAILVGTGALLLMVNGSQADLLVMPASIHTLNGWLDVLGFMLILAGTVWSMRGFLWNGSSPQKAITGAAILIGGTALAILKNVQGINAASPFIAALAIIAGTWFVSQSRAAANMSIDIERRRSRVRLYSIGFGVFSILTAVAILPFLPWYMGISDAKFKSVYIDKVPDENNGVYLGTDKGVMQLYGWSIEPDDFPSDSPVLDLTTVHKFVVVSKQFDVPDAYQLYNGTTGQQVKWQSISQQGVELTFTAASLDPGNYEFVTPTDSMFGGDTYEYFTLR